MGRASHTKCKQNAYELLKGSLKLVFARSLTCFKFILIYHINNVVTVGAKTDKLQIRLVRYK